ncbi:hypothetical protein Ae201684P_001009 [Aphanomyces euteiches]|nr:hypothetical protein Ae201684P_001009 [Aphanomyces euteiches]
MKQSVSYRFGYRDCPQDWLAVEACVNSRISKELIERVGDRFMYYHHKYHFIGTNMLCIAGDELFQHPQNVLRPHGFSWTVFEEIAPGFTRIHNFAIQYTPITANGNN